MSKMLNPQGRRKFLSLPRPKLILVLAVASVTSYLLLFSGHAPRAHIFPYLREKSPTTSGSSNTSPAAHDELSKTKAQWHIEIEDLRYWRDTDDSEDPNDTLPGYETDGTFREPGDVGRLQHEKDLCKMWCYVYKTTANPQILFTETLKSLTLKNNRSDKMASALREDPLVDFDFAQDKPVRFYPYPDYNSDLWRQQGHAPYVPCKGTTGELVEDLLVFKGRPEAWPAPKFGSYQIFNLDPNLFWERDTRLGPFGLTQQKKKVGGAYEPVKWDNVNWGDLQQRCLKLNAARFDMERGKKNEYLHADRETTPPAKPPAKSEQSFSKTKTQTVGRSTESNQGKRDVKEKRTAILLRSYTGKKYTENNKQIIRSLVSELNLKTGGEYEVFLLVHSKDKSLRIFDDHEIYLNVLKENVPAEFRGMTVLWCYGSTHPYGPTP